MIETLDIQKTIRISMKHPLLGFRLMRVLEIFTHSKEDEAGERWMHSLLLLDNAICRFEVAEYEAKEYTTSPIVQRDNLEHALGCISVRLDWEPGKEQPEMTFDLASRGLRLYKAASKRFQPGPTEQAL